jgi:hypothetical protein
MPLILVALFAIACGEIHFIDPNPPTLFRAQTKFSPAAIDEPIVWIAIFNLFFEDESGCSWARDTTVGALRSAFAGAGGQQLELAAQDLAPGCRQRDSVQLDAPAVQAAFASSQAAFPSARIRPVVVYLDNIDAQLAPGTAALIASLRNGSTGLASLIWTVGFDQVGTQLRSERRLGWTYTGDPTFSSQIRNVVSSELPLRTTAARSTGPVQLLDASQLEVVHVMKVCVLPKDLPPDDPPRLGAAQVVDRARPPTLSFQLPQQVALPRSLYNDVMYSVVVEACSGNCDRYFIREAGDPPQRWDEMTACAMVNR